ncbi:MAG: serine/threonine-protein phosphatase [Chloroflexi bacterium]|nr:serine/threonine-protein phosphatase [Chloroflexota bacterium]MBP7044497.1 serine/threonine-protein phosphatase [Chloroflexota bacterium]
MAIQADKNYDPRLVGAVTDQGPTRQGNQDALWVPDRATPTELGALYVVADGVGGQEHGAEAARMVTAVLSDVFYRQRQQGRPVAEALVEAVTQANQAVFDDAKSRDARMGSTVVAAVVESGVAWVAHVGDARAYLVEGRKLRPLTRDDTWVQNQVDAGIISLEMAEKHEFRNVVTQALGNRQDVNVHITQPQPFAFGATLLLCSDGLYDAVPPEIMYDLTVQESAQTAARALVNAAIEAQASDNITAVVIKSSLANPAVLPAKSARSGQSVPLWLPVAITVVVVVVVAALLGIWQASRPPDNGGPGTAVSTEAAPVIAPDAAATDLATAVATEPPQPTITPQPTLEAVAEPASAEPATAEPPTAEPPTAEPPTPTSLPPLPQACIVTPGQVFVWPDAAMAPGGCQTAVSKNTFITGDLIFLVGDGSRSLPIPGDCGNFSDFIQVQSQTDSDIIGWVFLNQIKRLEPGEACVTP